MSQYNTFYTAVLSAYTFIETFKQNHKEAFDKVEDEMYKTFFNTISTEIETLNFAIMNVDGDIKNILD